MKKGTTDSYEHAKRYVQNNWKYENERPFCIKLCKRFGWELSEILNPSQIIMTKKTFKTKCDQENMCDSCDFGIAECCATDDDFKYGNGAGEDNIIECEYYSGNEYELE